MRNLGFAILITLSSAACSTQAPDPCRFESVTIPATFLGDAYARGSISVNRDTKGRLVGRAQLVRVEGQEATEGPALDLSGPARCVDGLVKVELGAGRTEDGRLKVLGGEIHVVLPRAGLVDRAFGTWRAELLQEGWQDAKQMAGPWVVSTSSVVVAVR